jgi:hypothetical protein
MLIFDLEADALYDKVTQIWCIHTHCTVTGLKRRFWDSDVTHPTIPRDGSLSDGVQYLTSYDGWLCGHNIIAFDKGALEKVYGLDLSNLKLFDTLILSRWLKPQRFDGGVMGHSLAAFGERLGIPKVVNEDWSAHTPLMVERCDTDVDINVKVLHSLIAELGRPLEDVWYSLTTEFDFQDTVLSCERQGWHFDVEGCNALIDTIKAESASLEERIRRFMEKRRTIIEKVSKTTGLLSWCKPLKKDGTYKQTIIKNYEGAELLGTIWGDFTRIIYEDINLASDKQVKEVLLSLGWRPTEWNISKKTNMVTSPKLTEDSYDSLPVGVGADIARYRVLTHRVGYLNSQLTNILPTGGVPCYINTIGTVAHRVTHKVLVNTPASGKPFGSEIRALYTAPNGYKVVGCDLEGAHLRILADVMEDKDYRDQLTKGVKEDGTDNHSVLAKASNITRNESKTLIYSFINGSSALGVSKSLHVTEKRAKEILKGIDVALPKYKETQQGAISFWKQHGYVETKDGRRLYPRKPSEVLSYYLLATESGVMKRASNITSAKIKEYGVSAWMVVYQHDEYGYLCEEKYVDWLKQVMIDSITQASNEMQQNYCPQVGDASHGDSWLDTH